MEFPNQDKTSIDLLTAPESSCKAIGVAASLRPHVGGKFLFVGDQKLYVRGVTYGPFRPEVDGSQYHNPEAVNLDFAQMVEHGINAVRLYTVPPRWLLDIAHQHGLWVMVGLPWEQHITFLDDPKRACAIEQRIRNGVRDCAEHPAVLCYTIGNEIPASIVRWYGRRRIERFLKRLYLSAKAEDPNGLVTYVNFPTTEYLQLSFLDFVCFNVYLESQAKFETYLARLQNIAGDRPLIMAETGLDSRRNGTDTQARVLDWQIRTAFAVGCSGLFVFAWTDEWFRGGFEIEDWDFGLVDRKRQPKPALHTVRESFADVPLPSDLPWPKISVAVCSYNGARVIRHCCEGLLKLQYPNYEVIVVNDGSKDATAAIASEYDFRVISTENRGLSNARNTAMEAATGEIIAYLDDDASPDPHWLMYLAATFLSTPYAGVGGPNIPPLGDGPIADCVANSPGGPLHVLISDREAEHIPGCNMAFWKSALQSCGGFDPQYRTAGDDVDICWRLQQKGWTLGFSPAAMVWHHRRNSVKMYWKQQVGYGKAEALLERKWPEKYNPAGHLTWSGRIYGKGLMQPLVWPRWRVYHGMWGCAPFQSLYQPTPGSWSSLPLMPEWYLLMAALAVLAVLSVLWKPFLVVLPLLLLAIAATITQAILGALHTTFINKPRTRYERVKLQSLTAFLHLIQPLARLYGRLLHGLTPWRRRQIAGLFTPWPRVLTMWSERWHSPFERLERLEQVLQACSASLIRGGNYDTWDMEVRGGLLGGIRLRMVIEEHGGGKQLVRMRIWPKCSPIGLVFVILFALAVVAALDHEWVVCFTLATSTTFLAFQMVLECADAMAIVLHAYPMIQNET